MTTSRRPRTTRHARRGRHALVGAVLVPSVLAAGTLLGVGAAWTWERVAGHVPPTAATAVATTPDPTVTPAVATPAVPTPAVATPAAATHGPDPAPAPEATVRVVVMDAAGRTLLAGRGATEHFYTASLVKLLVVEQLFREEEAGELHLDGVTRAEMRRAVEASDDGAMNALWSGFDGPRLVTDAAAEFHLADTVPTRIPGRWGSSVTTATDYATFLHALPAHLDDADRATLDGWMHATTPTAADGFDQDFGVLAPGLEPAGAVAAKQGWTCCVGGWRDLHSAGVLPDGRVVVALGAFPVSTSYAQAARTIDHAVADAVRHTG